MNLVPVRFQKHTQHIDHVGIVVYYQDPVRLRAAT
jgi:hypothetical protein